MYVEYWQMIVRKVFRSINIESKITEALLVRKTEVAHTFDENY